VREWLEFRGEGRFTVVSLRFKVNKEKAGRGFNAEIAEDAECGEFGTEKSGKPDFNQRALR